MRTEFTVDGMIRKTVALYAEVSGLSEAGLEAAATAAVRLPEWKRP